VKIENLQTFILHVPMLEYIPWMRDCFEEPATVEEGHFVPPERPGTGTTLKADTLARYDVS
jgi:L-alanine-DL-glutamate epimerase-like enolase superfamily enzyme